MGYRNQEIEARGIAPTNEVLAEGTPTIWETYQIMLHAVVQRVLPPDWEKRLEQLRAAYTRAGGILLRAGLGGVEIAKSCDVRALWRALMALPGGEKIEMIRAPGKQKRKINPHATVEVYRNRVLHEPQ